MKLVPLAGNPRLSKCSLSDLVPYRGKQVDVILDESIDKWLHQRSFNRCEDIATLLEQLKIPVDYCNVRFPELDAMILRRHSIVHNVDRPKVSDGAGSTEADPVDRDSVKEWRNAVEELMKRVLYKLQFVVDAPAEARAATEDEQQAN